MNSAISGAVQLLGQQRQGRQQGIENINKSIQTLGSLGKARKMKKAGMSFMKKMAEGMSMEQALEEVTITSGLSNEEARDMVVTTQSFHKDFDADKLRKIDNELVEEGSALAKHGTNIGKDLVGKTNAEARHIIKLNDPGKPEIVTGEKGRQQAWYPGQSKIAPEGTTTDETYRAGLDGFLGKKYKPDNVTLWKDGKSKVINKNNAEAMQKALDAGFKEEGKEFAKDMQQYRRRSDGAVKNVNINDLKAITKARKDKYLPVGVSETTFLQEAGKAGSKRLEEFSVDAGRAREQVATLQLAGHYLGQFESGKLTDWKEQFMGIAEALGIGNIKFDEKLGAMQAFNAIAERMVLQSRNLGPGQVLAGQMSDRDVEFLRNMNIGLTKSPEGNRQLIKVLTVLANRRIKIAELAQEFTESHGGVFNSTKFAKKCKEKGYGSTSIFSIPEGAKPTGKNDKNGLPIFEIKQNGKIIRFIPGI